MLQTYQIVERVSFFIPYIDTNEFLVTSLMFSFTSNQGVADPGGFYPDPGLDPTSWE